MSSISCGTVTPAASSILSGQPGLAIRPAARSIYCAVGRPLDTSVVGIARELGLFNERMPLSFGIKYGHMKLWIPLFDFERRLLRRVVRLVPGLQLPIDGNVKWFGKRRLAEFSNRGSRPVGDGSPCLPRSI
ncbi:MAG: hypothetical protein P4M05_26755 [Bradyrhizobium sp.]|nr:hypothetical protein [Bradyrhizobium sp.]